MFFGTAIYHFGTGINLIIEFAIIALLVSAFIAFWQATTGRTRVTRVLRYYWTIPTGASTTVAGATAGLRLAAAPTWLPDGLVTKDTPG